MYIETTLTKNQYIKLNLLFIIRRVTFYFVIAVFFIFLILGLLSEDKVGIFTAFGYLGLMIIVYTISILHMGLSKKNRNFFLRKQYTFDDEKILAKTPVSEEVIKWEAFVSWKKVASYYLLYLSTRTFIIIPKMDIPAGEVGAFKELLGRKINIAKSKI